MISKSTINKWNNKFKTLSKPEKRVLIAKDVLLQIKLGKYKPERAGYLAYIELGEEDIQSNFDKIQNCKCCNLGACVLSMTKFANKLTGDEVKSSFSHFQNPSSKVSKMLKRIFSPKQMALIEAVFENGDSNHANGAYKVKLNWKEQDKCITFYRKYDTSKERTIATMKNIISNKGTFKP